MKLKSFMNNISSSPHSSSLSLFFFVSITQNKVCLSKTQAIWTAILGYNWDLVWNKACIRIPSSLGKAIPTMARSYTSAQLLAVLADFRNYSALAALQDLAWLSNMDFISFKELLEAYLKNLVYMKELGNFHIRLYFWFLLYKL